MWSYRFPLSLSLTTAVQLPGQLARQLHSSRLMQMVSASSDSDRPQSSVTHAGRPVVGAKQDLHVNDIVTNTELITTASRRIFMSGSLPVCSQCSPVAHLLAHQRHQLVVVVMVVVEGPSAHNTYAPISRSWPRDRWPQVDLWRAEQTGTDCARTDRDSRADRQIRCETRAERQTRRRTVAH